MPSLCPRCGSLGSPYVARGYLYYSHGRGKGKRICYIGPVKGYTNVARMYDIEIFHAFNIEHRLQVLLSLLSQFSFICSEKVRSDCEEIRREYEECVRDRGWRNMECVFLKEEFEICKNKKDVGGLCSTLKNKLVEVVEEMEGGGLGGSEGTV